MAIWRLIVHEPEKLADRYEEIWNAQHRDPIVFYNEIRDGFNQRRGAAELLFLLARCVKNAVRFNAQGIFNQSPDKRRFGTKPERMRRNIFGAHRLLSERTSIDALDYADVLEKATATDLVYMDPPYQGTSGNRDQRYHQQLDRDRFVEELRKLLDRGVPFLISFDGRCGTKTYGPRLPSDLGLTQIEIHAGRSSQATLNGLALDTYESLYLSPGLGSCLGECQARIFYGASYPVVSASVLD